MLAFFRGKLLKQYKYQNSKNPKEKKKLENNKTYESYF